MNTYSKKYSRKKFITFLGKVTLGTTIIPPFLISCGNTSIPIKLGELSNDQLERLKKLSFLKNWGIYKLDFVFMVMGYIIMHFIWLI